MTDLKVRIREALSFRQDSYIRGDGHITGMTRTPIVSSEEMQNVIIELVTREAKLVGALHEALRALGMAWAIASNTEQMDYIMAHTDKITKLLEQLGIEV